jgi:hypothetical protein
MNKDFQSISNPVYAESNKFLKLELSFSRQGRVWSAVEQLQIE